MCTDLIAFWVTRFDFAARRVRWDIWVLRRHLRKFVSLHNCVYICKIRKKIATRINLCAACAIKLIKSKHTSCWYLKKNTMQLAKNAFDMGLKAAHWLDECSENKHRGNCALWCGFAYNKMQKALPFNCTLHFLFDLRKVTDFERINNTLLEQTILFETSQCDVQASKVTVLCSTDWVGIKISITWW